jgi:hypothetical protein
MDDDNPGEEIMEPDLESPNKDEVVHYDIPTETDDFKNQTYKSNPKRASIMNLDFFFNK